MEAVLEEPKTIESSAETINFLAGVDRFIDDLTNHGLILETTREGVFRDEETHSAEDAMIEFSAPRTYELIDGKINTEQGWLSEVSVIGEAKGRELVESDRRFGFELARRQVETRNIHAIEAELSKGMEAGVIIEASPFPTEAYQKHPDQVKKLQYKHEEAGFFFRISRWQEGKVVVQHVSMPGSDVAALAETMRGLAAQGDWLTEVLPEDATSLDILAAPAVVGKDLFADPGVEVAQRYSAYGFTDNWPRFQEIAMPYIDEIVAFSEDLARGQLGQVSEKVIEQLWQAGKAKVNGRYMLPAEQRQVLADAIEQDFENGISREAAEVLKKYFTYSTWALIHAQMNPDQAEKLYGKDKTAELLEMASSGASVADTIYYAGTLAAEAGRCAGGCGGGIEYNIFDMASAEYKNFLSGGSSELKEGNHVHCPDCGKGQKLRKEKSEESGKDYFVCVNPRCAKKVEA